MIHLTIFWKCYIPPTYLWKPQWPLKLIEMRNKLCGNPNILNVTQSILLAILYTKHFKVTSSLLMLPMWVTHALEKQEEAKNSLPFILHGLHPRPHHDGGKVPRQVASCWLLVLSNSFYKNLPTEKLRCALFTLCTLLLRLLPTSISNRVSDQCEECTLDNN